MQYNLVMYTTLISTNELAKHLDDENWVIVDCRFVLADPDLEESNYLKTHIRGAAYAHLNTDMSSRVIPGKTGRHPWPSVEDATKLFSKLGIGSNVQVVAYDDAGGALAAVRLWWMLRWLGHSQAAVLDGGWSKWMREGLPVQGGRNARPENRFIPDVRPELIVSAAQVDAMRTNPDYRVCDARTADRYRGENETIDPVAGHIPGAISLPYPENLTPDGVFRSSEELKAHYQKALVGIPAENTIFYCGSGVTSIHNILAMMHAGLGETKVYAGSWSEWITDPRRAVA